MRQVNHMHSIGVYLLEIGGGAIAKTADFESSAGIETLKQGTPSQAISAKIQTGIDCVVEDKRKSPGDAADDICNSLHRSLRTSRCI